MLKSAKIVTEHNIAKIKIRLQAFFGSSYSVGISSDFKVIEFFQKCFKKCGVLAAWEGDKIEKINNMRLCFICSFREKRKLNTTKGNKKDQNGKDDKENKSKKKDKADKAESKEQRYF